METARLLLQCLQLIIVVIGLGYTAYQIKLLRLGYRDLHDWNRRKAAQEALNDFVDLAAGNKIINESFQFLENHDPIPLSKVQDKCEEVPELRAAIHRLLNTYESMALGVLHGLYDESLIREAMRWVMPLTLAQFSEYIGHRRNRGVREMWLIAERLTAKWKQEEDAKISDRPRTGVIS